MYMTNVKVLIKPDETPQDIIAELCDDCGLRPNEPFAFSAIISPSKEATDCQDLKINCLDQKGKNPYTPESLVSALYAATEHNGIRYAQPPPDQWIELWQPFLISLVDRVYPRYEKLIPDRSELMSILYFTVAKLHSKGYYLHKSIVQRAFVNELNMECRALKGMNVTESLDAVIGQDDEGKDLTLLDQLADPESTEWAKRCGSYTDDDYWEEMLERLKSVMIKDMGELQFKRILIQLKTRTVDRKTSYWLNKYRDIFNPGYTPRPNAKGKPKGGKK